MTNNKKDEPYNGAEKMIENKYLVVFSPPMGTTWKGKYFDINIKPNEFDTYPEYHTLHGKRYIPLKNVKRLYSGDAVIVDEKAYKHYSDGQISSLFISEPTIKVEKLSPDNKLYAKPIGHIEKDYIAYNPQNEIPVPKGMVNPSKDLLNVSGEKVTMIPDRK